MSRAARVALAALIVPAVALAERAEQTASGPADHAALPPPPLARLPVPAGWQPQPALIEAARAAASADLGPRALAAAAWANPLRGCYLVDVAINLDSDFVPSALLAQVRAVLDGAATVDGWVDDQWVARASLARPGWQGELRAAVTAGNRPTLEVVACFHNDRAPDRCRTECAPLLAAMPSPPPTSKAMPPRTP